MSAGAETTTFSVFDLKISASIEVETFISSISPSTVLSVMGSFPSFPEKTSQPSLPFSPLSVLIFTQEVKARLNANIEMIEVFIIFYFLIRRIDF